MPTEDVTVATRAGPLVGLKNPQAAFIGMHGRGYWAIVTYPRGTPLPKKRGPALGKEPIGLAWGARRWTLDKSADTFRSFPGAGVGVCLGPGRAPGGGWLIDVEGDGPEAEQSRTLLFGGEQVETIGWGSVRGRHQLLRLDGERMKAIAAKLKPYLVKDANQPGVFKIPALPGLELRIGAYKPDGTTVKQLQSVCPPTPGTDGQPRAWNGIEVLAVAPDAFYSTLERIGDEAEATARVERADSSRSRPKVQHEPGAHWGMPCGKATNRADSWLKRTLANEVARIEATGPGERRNAYRDKAYELAGWLHYNERYGIGYSETELAGRLKSALAIGVGPNDPVVEVTVDEAIAAGKAAPRNLKPELHAIATGETNGKASANGKASGNGNGRHPQEEPDWAEIGETEASERAKAASAFHEFTNFILVEKEGEDGETKTFKDSCRVDELDEMLATIAPGWPKRVVDALFVTGSDYRPIFLSSATRLFAWIDRMAAVDWSKGARFVTQERYYEHRRMTSERFDAVETLPQWPPLPGHYYMHEPVDWVPGGRLLDQLLDQFSPLTTVDRELIRAFVFTLFWGGPPGSRPAFLITGPDDDPEQGRGVGKSYMISILVEELARGFVEVSPTDQIAEVKTRLLSPEARQIRVARLDNVKTLRFSWADLEGLITSPVISGRELYSGEGRRPNTLVWAITLNGASLSKDMAQRVAVIKLKRPAYDPLWESNVREFIRANRPGLLAEIRAAMEDEPGHVTPSRWSIWERHVLSKTDDLKGCQGIIADRQGSIDDDMSEKNLVADAFAERLRERGHDPVCGCVLIPSVVAAQWLSDATRTKYATNAASVHIKCLSIHQLTKCDRESARGWVWMGSECDPRIQPSDLRPLMTMTAESSRLY